jgi:hypothetical protein
MPMPPSLTRVEFAPAALAPGEVLRVRITVENDSDEPLTTQDPPPDFVYEEGDSYLSRGFVEQAGAVRVGVDFDGRSGIDHPYRWGLGGTLQPGESATITGGIRLRTPQARTYWAGLAREQIAWLVTRQAMQTIRVSAPGPSPDELRRQVAALQAQAASLQEQITRTNQQNEQLRAAVGRIKQLLE